MVAGTEAGECASRMEPGLVYQLSVRWVTLIATVNLFEEHVAFYLKFSRKMVDGVKATCLAKTR